MAECEFYLYLLITGLMYFIINVISVVGMIIALKYMHFNLLGNIRYHTTNTL
jgi:hypothetical protein